LSITQIDRAKAEKIVNSTGADTLSSKNHKVDLPSFMRMLAKVAHGLAYATFHPSGFVPLLPDYILGKDPHLPFVVGGATQQAPLGTMLTIGYQGPDGRLGHQIGCGPAINAHNGRAVLLSHVQLFSFLPHAPVYEIFVATVPDRTKLMRVHSRGA
jgi:hypothetical protein